ncbi:MAG: winged helix-turn-helix transcriptional regulator [Candidatus Diapherotrites archaeon]|uniref:Winged helix-turn-helix transcriptional regulator n=1 Tax=Candidatus Iainarchaeum sp. TaxID=3101447 RepID=A0A8T4LA87_9ARCH|nr:winged helix-turn-helix transcriptional regulator [Candidatus Diapherotrites archaeon]
MADVTLSSSEFKALSSDTRTQIIKYLGERNYTLSELAKKLGMSSPAAKEHLDILARTGLVQLNDEGRKWKYYALTRKGRQLLGGEENRTTFLIILSASAIALFGVLLLFANSLNGASLAEGFSGGMTGETASPLLAKNAAEEASTAMTVQAPTAAPRPATGTAEQPADSTPGLNQTPYPAQDQEALDRATNETYAYLALALGLSAFIGFQAGRLRRDAI